MLVLIITLGSSWASPANFDTSQRVMLLGDKDKQVALSGSALPPLIGYRLGLSRSGNWIARSQLFLLSSKAA
jgi:phage protein U